MKNISNTDLLAVRVISEGRRMEKERADSLVELLEIINSLHAERDKAKSERDAALEKIAQYQAGIEGSCMTCEPVGVRNQQMEREIATLKIERDELRCEVCDWVGNHFKEPPQDVAKRNGWNCFDTGVWDCYKEKSK